MLAVRCRDGHNGPGTDRSLFHHGEMLNRRYHVFGYAKAHTVLIAGSTARQNATVRTSRSFHLPASTAIAGSPPDLQVMNLPEIWGNKQRTNKHERERWRQLPYSISDKQWKGTRRRRRRRILLVLRGTKEWNCARAATGQNCRRRIDLHRVYPDFTVQEVILRAM